MRCVLRQPAKGLRSIEPFSKILLDAAAQTFVSGLFHAVGVDEMEGAVLIVVKFVELVDKLFVAIPIACDVGFGSVCHGPSLKIDVELMHIGRENHQRHLAVHSVGVFPHRAFYQLV